MATTVKADRGKAAVPGLQRWELASGATRWRLRWRDPAAGEQRSMLFDAPDLRKARGIARGYLEAVDSGHDPRPGKRRPRLTFGHALWLWAMAHRRVWKPRTRREYVAILKRRVPAELRARPLRSLQRGELRKVVRDVETMGHTVEANRLLAVLKSCFAWLVKANQEHLGVEHNLTAGLEKSRETPRDRVYSDDELRAILASGDPFLCFLAHTGVRESEGRSLTWPDVRGKLQGARIWRIPSAAAKSGVSRLVPLTAPVVRILAKRRRTYDARPWRASRDQKSYAALSQELGFAVRPHDLRRTLGQWVKDNHGPAAMHATLGHAELTLTRTYGPAPSTERVRAILSEWSARLGELS